MSATLYEVAVIGGLVLAGAAKWGSSTAGGASSRRRDGIVELAHKLGLSRTSTAGLAAASNSRSHSR